MSSKRGNKSGGCKWNNDFGKLFPGITAAKNGKKDHCHCVPCKKDISIFHKGKKDIENHVNTKDHKGNVNKSAGTLTLTSHFNGKTVRT